MKPVTLNVGERDERGRVFKGWTVWVHSPRGTFECGLFPTRERTVAHKSTYHAEMKCVVKARFTKENRYRKALRELVHVMRFCDPREHPSMYRARERAEMLLEES